jgi:hypothetical protein
MTGARTTSDSFSYKVCDNATSSLCSGTVMVSNTVNPVNDAPVAQNGTLTTDEDTPKTGTLVATDVDSATLTTAWWRGQPRHGDDHQPDTGAYSYARR